jgi:hypothetical protein
MKNRRDFIKKSATMAAAISVAGLAGCSDTGKSDSKDASQKQVAWPVTEGPDTPKLCVGGAGSDEKRMKDIKQMGVDYILGGGGPFHGKKRVSVQIWTRLRRMALQSLT